MADLTWLDKKLLPPDIVFDGDTMPRRSKVSYEGPGLDVADDEANDTTRIIGSGGGSSGHVIKSNGTPFTARSGLNFIGFDVADNAVNDETTVTGGVPLNYRPVDYTLDASYTTPAIGHCVCSASLSSTARVVKATSANMLLAGGLLAGIVVATPGGGKVRVAGPGSILDTTISGLGAGTAGLVRVSATGTLERISVVSYNDCVAGTVDTFGTVTLAPVPAGMADPFSFSKLGTVITRVRADNVSLISGAASQWNDFEGPGNNFTQGTAGSRPLFVASAINGRPALQSDGVDDFMTGSGAVAGNSAHTLFVVCKFSSNPVNSTRGICCYGNASATGGSSSIGQGSANPAIWDFGGAGQGLSGPTADTNPHVVAKISNGTTTTAYIDGVQVATGSLTYNSINTSIDLFRHATGGGSAPACVGEFVAMQGALSVGGIVRGSRYLGAWWGITVA